MSSNPELELAVVRKVIETLGDQLAPLGLPFILVIGIPNETGPESGVARASFGLTDPRNRAFLLGKIEEYLGQYDRGEVKMNRRRPDN